MVNIITAILLILFAALSRLIPHPPNFAPIVAIALFSGVYLDKKYAFIVPIIAMLISDAIIGFHSGMIWVYGSFVIIAFLGLWLKSRKSAAGSKKFGYIFGTALVSSVIFFIITNFGVWTSGFYGLDFKGLVECYAMAIPFFKNSVAGDVFYVALMFGIYEIVKYYAPKEVLSENKIHPEK
ncbi:MAG: DUF6580 family putative transport protein [Ignavibacteria bacterium]